jgi:hypothetical protein
MDEDKLKGRLVLAIIIMGVCIIGFWGYLYPSMASARSELSPINNRDLKASVKGSIYEPGELMSVFGICSDAYDVPIANSTALFSAWYPNGTAYLVNVSIANISDGYYLWQGIMPSVEGTFLTEFDCLAWGQIARAFGEWQNPAWVNRLDDIQNMTNETVINIAFLQQNITENFNYTNILIATAAATANASVDRNNSLLASLLYSLINFTYYPPTILTNLTFSSYDVDTVMFWKDWTIKGRVYDGTGRKYSDPEVYCLINTTLSSVQYMTPVADYFTATIFISQSSDFGYTVNCFFS